MPHERDIEHGEIGENGYEAETVVCIHCGEVFSERSPEEVERLHVTDMIRSGEVTPENLSDGALDKGWIVDALREQGYEVEP